MQISQAQIWIIDFGSQYTQLIARKVRELHHSSMLLSWHEARQAWQRQQYPQALILSGGPGSLAEDQEDYSCLKDLPALPMLGICYGMQIIGKVFGGRVQTGKSGEYGPQQVEVLDEQGQVVDQMPVWMSHGDQVAQLPPGFKAWMQSGIGLAAMRHTERLIWGVQFHIEVKHTPRGQEILQSFLQAAQLTEDWPQEALLQEAQAAFTDIHAPILCAFSGGVDSLVAATLAARQNLPVRCFFVDNGLLRPQDKAHIKTLQQATNLSIEVIDAAATFLTNLKGVTDPETKRKIIGQTFIKVFEQQVHAYEQRHQLKFKYLLQGTLYPDVIESRSPRPGGKSVTIKSHHNVGGLPATMALELIEPLKFLFKDEVRLLGLHLGLRKEWVFRHPFPGPGIGVRVLGEVRPELVQDVQHADQILLELMQKFSIYDRVWQAFPVLIPQKTVGVKGDARAYEYVMALRIVNSSDGMTAQWAVVPPEFLAEVSTRITNEIAGITRVVYDITSKPPGTIEWE